MSKLPQTALPLLIRVPPRNDRNHNTLNWAAAESDLCRIAGTEALAAREGKAGQVFEEGALVGGLAADDYDLEWVRHALL